MDNSHILDSDSFSNGGADPLRKDTNTDGFQISREKIYGESSSREGNSVSRFHRFIFQIWIAYKKITYTHNASFAQRLRSVFKMSPQEFNLQKSSPKKTTTKQTKPTKTKPITQKNKISDTYPLNNRKRQF